MKGLKEYTDTVDNDELKEFGKVNANQYAIRPGKRYEPIGESVKGLPAGFYNIQVTWFATYFQTKEIQTDDLVELPGSTADVAFKDMQTFLKSKDRYKKAGLMHKRAYIFHGPPGTGKTSLCIQLGNKVAGINGLVLVPSSLGNLISGFEAIKSSEKDRPILFILEEVQDLLSEADGDDTSTFLSILDGEGSAENIMFVATTNYLEMLEPRIRARPGRFDVVSEIGTMETKLRYSYAYKILSRFCDPAEAEKIAKAVSDATDGLSMAHIKEVVVASQVLRIESIEEATARLKAALADIEDEDEDEEEEDEDDDDNVPMVTKSKKRR